MRGILVEVKTQYNQITPLGLPENRFYDIVVKKMGPDTVMRALKIAEDEFMEVAKAEGGQEHIVGAKRIKEVILECS